MQTRLASNSDLLLPLPPWCTSTHGSFSLRAGFHMLVTLSLPSCLYCPSLALQACATSLISEVLGMKPRGLYTLGKRSTT